MKKKKKRGWKINPTMLGIITLMVISIFNLAFASLGFAVVCFKSAPIGIAIWYLISLAFVLISFYFFTLDAAED